MKSWLIILMPVDHNWFRKYIIKSQPFTQRAVILFQVITDGFTKLVLFHASRAGAYILVPLPPQACRHKAVPPGTVIKA